MGRYTTEVISVADDLRARTRVQVLDAMIIRNFK